MGLINGWFLIDWTTFYSSIVVKQALERPVSINNGALKICKLTRDQNGAFGSPEILVI